MYGDLLDWRMENCVLVEPLSKDTLDKISYLTFKHAGICAKTANQTS